MRTTCETINQWKQKDALDKEEKEKDLFRKFGLGS